MKSIAGILFFCLIVNNVYSQSVGIGTTTPHGSAVLDLASTTRGLLIPRMSGAQRNAISLPLAGMIVYQTNTDGIFVPGLYMYEGIFGAGGSWKRMARSDEAGGGSYWTASGTHIYNSNSGNVGIGILSPLEKFHLVGDFRQDNGQMTLNYSNAMIQFQNAGVNKAFMQLSGDNLRLGTSNGNQPGRAIFNIAGSDRVFIDSTGNVQIVGLQDVSLATHGSLTLGSLTGDNLILDAQEIQARNNGDADDMVLQNEGGNVGIGVFPPMEKLDVYGHARLTGGARLLKFETAQFTGLIPKFAPGLSFIRSDGTDLGGFEYVDTSGANFMRIRMGSEIVNGIVLNTSNNVGIGILQPAARMHIRGTNGIDELAINSGWPGESATIQFYNTLLSGGALGAKLGFVQLDGTDLKIGINSGNNSGRFIIRTGSADRVFVDDAGNMSVGTSATAAGYIFNVGGKAICEELKVQMSSAWPDYVFKDNYRLRTIDELRTFIKENGHLPSIPKAEELEKNGMEVGDMQKRMMEKIEELTLYIIQLKDEIDSLKKSRE